MEATGRRLAGQVPPRPERPGHCRSPSGAARPSLLTSRTQSARSLISLLQAHRRPLNTSTPRCATSVVSHRSESPGPNRTRSRAHARPSGRVSGRRHFSCRRVGRRLLYRPSTICLGRQTTAEAQGRRPGNGRREQTAVSRQRSAEGSQTGPPIAPGFDPARPVATATARR